MGKSVSKSLESSAAKSAYSLGESMVISNSGLSLFDYPINRENRNVVVNLLSDLQLPIIAIWLVSRPIDRLNAGFEHWCIKIQCKGALISIDYLESSGKGAFGLQTRTDVGAELDDFLFYYIVDPKTGAKIKHKWTIISSVTPHPMRNTEYVNYLSDHDRFKLVEYIRNAKIAPKDPAKFMKDIQCKKRVCDIAEFCSLFTADNKGYNPLTKNCQQFAAQLFAYLVGDYYHEEIERVFARYQSPFDKKQWKDGNAMIEVESKSISPTNDSDKYQRDKSVLIKNSRKRRSMQTEEFFNKSSIDDSFEEEEDGKMNLHQLTRQKS